MKEEDVRLRLGDQNWELELEVEDDDGDEM